MRYESFSNGIGEGNLDEALNYMLLCRGLIIDIRENGGEYPHADLLKRSHESKEIFGKIIDTLVDADEIRTEWRSTGGRKQQRVYVLTAETSPKNFPDANTSQ